MKNKKKQDLPKKSNDEIRKTILSFLKEKRQKARGLESIGARPSELKKILKQQGLTENEIARNLDYLIQSGWVIKDIKKYPIPGKRVSGEKISFKLSKTAVEYFEGPSAFGVSESFSGINITNIGGITQVGRDNYASNQFVDLYTTLDQLGKEIRLSDKFTDKEKYEYQVDIKTLQDQLAKPNPEKSLFQKFLDKLKTLAPLLDTALKVKELVEVFLRQ